MSDSTVFLSSPPLPNLGTTFVCTGGMTSISIVESKLPPGFRFHPRVDELVCDYLLKKVTHAPFDSRCPHMVEVDLNKCEPWDIPVMTCVGGKEGYFYSHLDRKYATGSRKNRANVSGYWKATGKGDGEG